MPRGRKHFKLLTSIQTHRKTVDLWSDDSLLAMYARAGVVAVENYADRTDDSFLVSGSRLCEIAGASGVANARRKLGRLEATGMASVRPEGGGWRVRLPNFAEKQGFTQSKSTNRGGSATATATATATAVSDPPAKRAKREIPGWALELSEHLIETLRTVPGAAIGRNARTQWALSIAKLAREASVEPQDIRAGIDYALSPDALEDRYMPVIRSGAALREKWPKLVQHARRKQAEDAPKRAADKWVREGR